eukprot:TRINITY_DN24520_c0_g1_i1.p1 TRINITY_DN24520_c0_g1~~TRINITY_DN24520_c0_g1_i1.p1  ORF type:complete len:110 (-),score=24.02 TRINITY_DN24520_c0_g1_i1:111-440(-)
MQQKDKEGGREQIILVPENNNLPGGQAHLKEQGVYQCDLCIHKTDSENQLKSHVLEVHSEVIAKLAKILPNLNSNSTKLLEGTPTSEWILTPEEITQLGIDWRIYPEIF